jgi:hypothetical protein
MVDLATEVPYEMAAGIFGRLTGIEVSSERMHALTHQAAEGLTLLEVAPSRGQVDQLVAQVAKGRFRHPVLVLGVDGAYVPSRPESARGRRPARPTSGPGERTGATSGVKPKAFGSTTVPSIRCLRGCEDRN